MPQRRQPLPADGRHQMLPILSAPRYLMTLPIRVIQNSQRVVAAAGIGIAGPFEAAIPHTRGTGIEGVLDELVLGEDKATTAVHHKRDVR